MWTPSHKEASLAKDLLNGRPPELFLGNSFADVAAEVRAAEVAFSYSTV